MSANPKLRLSDNIIGRNGGLMWHRLHSEREDICELQTLAPFDTIWVRTLNTCYRIFLLDPMTGRALVEGGSHFAEPTEAMVNGSTLDGCPLEKAWIGIGLRLEMWVNGNLVSTSPIQSVRVEHHTANEPITAAIQK